MLFRSGLLHRTQKDNAQARDWLFRSFAAGHADPEATLLGWVNWYDLFLTCLGKRQDGIVLLERSLD